jgi:hypothetical protein
VNAVALAAAQLANLRAGAPVHWHGAAADSFMTHLAIQEADPDGTATEWLDHVTDAECQGHAITRQHLLTGDLTGQAGRIDRAEIHRVTLPPGQATGRHTHPGGSLNDPARDVLGLSQPFGRSIGKAPGAGARDLARRDARHEALGVVVSRGRELAVSDVAEHAYRSAFLDTRDSLDHQVGAESFERDIGLDR